MAQYDGKRVIITGGVSGIGLATAKLLLDEGASVMVTGHGDASLDAARGELGSRAIVVKSDAAALANIMALAEDAQSRFGAVDALLICAGQNLFVPFSDMTEDLLEQQFAVNAKGPYFAVQKLAPLIPRGGAVVAITSVAAGMGNPMLSAYAASKAALRSMVRSMARELLPQGIRVNAVSPGPIDSGILEKSLPDEAAKQARQQMTEKNPMQRFGRSDEVAKAMLFLAFDATYITGTELVVDGGATQL